MKIIISLLLMINVLYATQPVYKSYEEIPSEYKWRIQDVYASWSEWEKDYNDLNKLMEEAQGLKGKLNKKPEILLIGMKIRDQLMLKMTRLQSYITLIYSVDSRNQEIRSYYAKLQRLNNEIETKFLWLETEMQSISPEKLEKWVKKNKELTPYMKYLLGFHKGKEHTLSEEQQKLMSELGNTLSAGEFIYNSLSVTDIVFDNVKLSTGEDVTVNPSSLDEVFSKCQNQEDRKKISDKNLESYIRNKYTYAEIFTSILNARWSLAKIYHYPSCLNHAITNIEHPVTIYENLLSACGERLAPYHKYLDLRKRALGLEKFYKSDLNIGLQNYYNEYTYAEALELCGQSLAFLGTEYQEKLRDYLNCQSIDVYPVSGKRPGGSSMNIQGVHPYILLNFNGTRNSLFTLVHEIGHSLNSIYSYENQALINSDNSIFTAEVASIFNEMVLMDYMINHAKSSEERIDLLNQEIDNLVRKYYRICALAEFEHKAYQIVEQGNSADLESLSKLYSETDKKYYGESITFSENDQYGWVRQSHLYTRYYYLFQYATSYSAALSLFKKIKDEKDLLKKEQYKNQYLGFLKAGSHKEPLEILKDAGVDLTGKQAYYDVSDYMQELVDRLEIELTKSGKIGG